MVLIINSGQTENLAEHLNQDLVSGILEWRDDSDIDIKTKNVLSFILKGLQAIKPEFFSQMEPEKLGIGEEVPQSTTT